MKEEPNAQQQERGLTSLEATIVILRGIVPEYRFKPDGSDVLGEVPFQPADIVEFVCAWAAECGYDMCEPLCDTIEAFIRKGSTKTVKDLSDVIDRVFCGEPPPQRADFCDDGEHCRHFALVSAYKRDFEEMKEIAEPNWERQECYMCTNWDKSNCGTPCDCTLGKCAYRWVDPNGDKQTTFWKEN